MKNGIRISLLSVISGLNIFEARVLFMVFSVLRFKPLLSSLNFPIITLNGRIALQTDYLLFVGLLALWIGGLR